MFIRVEDIELRLIGVERRTGVFARGAVAAIARHSRQFACRADLEALDHFFQPVPVGRKILHDLHRAGARIQNGNDIRRLHLLVNELA